MWVIENLFEYLIIPLRVYNPLVLPKLGYYKNDPLGWPQDAAKRFRTQDLINIMRP